MVRKIHIKESNESRKWVNTELPKADWEKLRKFVKEQGYKYEASGAGNLVHIEMYLSSDEMKKVNDVIDQIDDGTYESYNRHSNRINRRRIKESVNVNVNKIANEVNKAIRQAVRDVQNDDASGTWHWYLDSDDRYDYELVLGFSGGFEPNENEFTDSYGNQLCLKWARISNRSAMNDYDVDYEFVTDPDTGDAWISETSINDYDATDDVKWLINDFNEFAEQYLDLN